MGAPDPMFSSLSAAERNLVRLLQSIQTGRIRHLSIRQGQPSLEAPMTVVRVLRLRPDLTATRSPTALADPSTDFLLRAEVVEMFRQTRAVTDGMIERLEVVDGLPTLIELAEPATHPPTSTSASAR